MSSHRRWCRLVAASLGLILSLLVSACAGTPPVAVTIKPSPRAQPAESMVPCQQPLPQLPTDLEQFQNIPAQKTVLSADQWRMFYFDLMAQVQHKLTLVSGTWIQATDAYFQCSSKQAAEAVWIRDSPQE